MALQAFDRYVYWMRGDRDGSEGLDLPVYLVFQEDTRPSYFQLGGGLEE